MSSNWKEEQMGKKIDGCLTDGIVKLGAGSAIGVVFSLLFFKRRAWPVIIGSGFGIGAAYTNCERSLNQLFKDSQ